MRTRCSHQPDSIHAMNKISRRGWIAATGGTLLFALVWIGYLGHVEAEGRKWHEEIVARKDALAATLSAVGKELDEASDLARVTRETADRERRHYEQLSARVNSGVSRGLGALRGLVEARASRAVAVDLEKEMQAHAEEVAAKGGARIERAHASFVEAYEACRAALPSSRHDEFCVPVPPAWSPDQDAPETPGEGLELPRTGNTNEPVVRTEGSPKKSAAAAKRPVEVSAPNEPEVVTDPRRQHAPLGPVPPPKPIRLFQQREGVSVTQTLGWRPFEDLPIELSARGPEETQDGKLKLVARWEGAPARGAILASFQCVAEACELVVAPREDGRLLALFESVPEEIELGESWVLLLEWDDEKKSVVTIGHIRGMPDERWMGKFPNWAEMDEG